MIADISNFVFRYLGIKHFTVIVKIIVVNLQIKAIPDEACRRLICLINTVSS